MQSVGPLSSRSCLESDNISEIKLNSRTMKTFEQVGSRLSSLLLMIILVGCIIHADAQFFAKSSKSIPRMGRRSGEPANPMDRYRRLLIDTFINGYGPGSFQTLETQARLADYSNVANRALSNGEKVFRDEPLDWKGSGEVEITKARGTRATSGGDSSLAMRALKTNRYIQYLESGQPLIFYGRLFNNREQDSSN